MDFIFNGAAHGDVATKLMAANMDPGVLRPYIGTDGNYYCTINKNGKPQNVLLGYGPQNSNQLITNAPATLRRDDWIEIDRAVIQAARPRLKAWGDLRASGNVYTIPNGMGKTTLESQNMSDAGPATMSMDPIRQGESERPEFDTVTMPLPVIHKDFHFSLRQIMTSRNSNTPLDTTMAEQASRKVAEEVEKLTIGVAAVTAIGGGNIYGYTNYPGRTTYDEMADPTDPGWVPNDTVKDVLAMRKASYDQNYNGPWLLYTSRDWDEKLDEDYSSAKGDNTLRDRIKKIEGISDIRSLDYLTGYQMILVQMTSDVARAVVGMELTTLQWESHGGLQQNFKVMCIMVPQLREDFYGQTGLVHGTLAP